MKYWFISFKFVFILTLFVSPALGLATSDKSYEYDNIDITITVNEDATINVSEQQIFSFLTGEFNQGWRSIPHRGLSRIEDIKVLDKNKVPLKYSSKQLNKYDPSSWGYYTVNKQGNKTNVECYFPPNSTFGQWTITYKVYGALSFLDEADELYWNLFTDYDVPVNNLNAKIVLPIPIKSDLITSKIYTSSGIKVDEQVELSPSYLWQIQAKDISPYEKFTIAIAWPKGVIDRSQFWADWFKFNYFWFVSGGLIILSLIIGLLYWYFTEHYNKNKRTIIPQYDPGQNMTPAWTGLIVKEKITKAIWPATIIDLAVRGYLKIEEVGKSKFNKIIQMFFVFLGVLLSVQMFVIFFTFWLAGNDSNAWKINFGLFILLGIIIFALGLISIRRSSLIKFSDYVLTKTDKPIIDLYNYEQEYLKIIFPSDLIEFKTADLALNPSQAKILGQKILKLEAKMMTELEKQTQAFKVSLAKEKKWTKFYFIGSYLIIFAGFIVFNALGLATDITVIGLTIVVCTFNLWLFWQIESRLSQVGSDFKWHLLGFKLYLKTAEKYRLANLDLKTFEKYLPYAMIFGVEKKWAKHFESLGLNFKDLTWYHSSHSVSGLGSNFNAVAFSTSLSQSFSSAFSHSSSGSSGGGSAGGGGGGGGGGAS